MIAKDLLAVAQSVHKQLLLETESPDEAMLILSVVQALLANDLRQMEPNK